MENRETFVLTLFCDPERCSDPGGRLRHVVGAQEATFKDLEELISLLRRFVANGMGRNGQALGSVSRTLGGGRIGSE
jgi:hypothetical protein